MPQSMCQCGCKTFYNKTSNNAKIMPEHRHEYRLRMARECMRRVSAAKRAGLHVAIPRKSESDKVDSICPRCRVHHRGDTYWQYCLMHESCRNARGDETQYMSW